MMWALKVKIPKKNYLVITLSGFLAMLAFKISKKLSIGLKIGNCSATNLAPTSAELSQWTTVWGSIIIHIPTTLLSLYAIAIYSPGQQKKINYSASIRDIELKFWG